MGKPTSFEARRTFGACAFDSRRYRQFLNWSVPPTMRQSGLNPEAPARDDCSTQLRSSMQCVAQRRRQQPVKL